MEKYFYSKGWSFVKKKSWGEFSVEDALRRHGKEEYTVLINSSSRPDSYIVIGKDYVIVYFLDDNLNEVIINTNSNYYNYPKFGCYEEFLKLDRYFDSW